MEPRYSLDPVTKKNLGGQTLDDFGGALGGPVVLPHLYDGKEKTFFFGAYEHYHEVQPTPTLTSVHAGGAQRRLLGAGRADYLRSVVDAPGCQWQLLHSRAVPRKRDSAIAPGGGSGIPDRECVSQAERGGRSAGEQLQHGRPHERGPLSEFPWPRGPDLQRRVRSSSRAQTRRVPRCGR